MMHNKAMVYIHGVYVALRQYNAPKAIHETVMNTIRTRLYEGVLQYDKHCFQRQALNCSRNLCGYCVGKWRSLAPGGGMLKRFTSVSLSLQSTTNIYYHVLKIYFLSKKRPLVCKKTPPQSNRTFEEDHASYPSSCI
jgi:hypothetical protein